MAYVMDRQRIYEKVQSAKLQRFMTNCYSMDVVEHCQKAWVHDDELIFSYEDHGIQRLIFFAKTWEAVDKLLLEIEKGRYYLEFMTKNPDEYIPNKSMKIASMMRFANSDCRNIFESDSQVMQYRKSVAVEYATEKDVEEINRILWSTFNTEISHLLSNEELKKKIELEQITIHRNGENRIDALLQADVMPKKFYINQIVNKGNRDVIHTILLNRLEKYVKAGGKYMYAWIEDKNIASIKFHEKYGMKHDGMWSMIYSIEV